MIEGKVFYVMGARAELDRVERFIARVVETGGSIAHDWTPGARAAGQSPRLRHEPPMSPETRRQLVRTMVDAVCMSDACVFLAPRASVTRGAWVELGISKSHGTHVVYVGHEDDSIFTEGCTVVADDDAAFAALEAM